MNTIFIIVLSSFGGFMTGLALTKRSRERELYYRDTVRLCGSLINNISYRADEISVVIGSAEISSHSLDKNLSEYKAYIGGGELSLSRNCLSKSEIAEIREFYLGLGKFDGETQIGELKRREEQFKQKYSEIKTKNDRQGSMYIKLGLLFGLLVGILLV